MKLLILLLTLTSCAALRSVSQTSIPADKSKKVTAVAERGIFFAFNFDNDYVDTLTMKLIEQCPDGSVEGITTKDEVIVYFPIIYHKSIVSAEGYCTKARRR